MGKIRLQKFMSQAGIASRRKSEELITELRVEICPTRHRYARLPRFSSVRNASLSDAGGSGISGMAQALRTGDSDKCRIAKIGDKIDPASDIVKVDGKVIKLLEKFIYYAVNKPVGYTSSVSDINAKKLVIQLVPTSPKVWPVGRLDKDSCGLMILTNDGELTNKLTHPRYRHEKEYEVKCRMQNIKIIIEKFKKGILLTEGIARFDRVEIINFDEERNIITIKVVLHQGWKRQIRRMCEKVDLRVTELKRTRIAKLELGDLIEGEFREIKKEKII